MRETVRSPAKINWTLRVVRRREDGYHDIESLVCAVTLYDELTFSTRDDDRFILTCSNPSLPCDDHNLICKAATLLATEARPSSPLRPLGASCHLTKNIPVGGGLGGGSSNAAATLLTLNRLWGLDLPLDQLASLAAHLGSDVPLFLYGPAAVIRGRGELVQPVRLGWRIWIVLILPDFAIATASVYRAWRPAPEPPAGRLAAPEDWLAPDGPDLAVRLLERAYNMLEPPAVGVCAPLRRLMEQLTSLAGRPVRLSGSGSTLFTAFDNRSEAESLARRAGEQLGLQTRVVQPVEQAMPVTNQV